MKAKAAAMAKQTPIEKKNQPPSIPRRVTSLKVGASLTSETVEAKCCKKFDERKAMFAGSTSGYSATCHAVRSSY